MGAEVPEAEKLVAGQPGRSQNSGPLPQHGYQGNDRQDSGVQRRREKKPQSFKKAVARCMRRVYVSPLYIAKRARDCYVSAMGGCANNYSSYHAGYGGGGSMSGPLSFSPGPANYRVRQMEAQRFDENCLSPAFKKAFNEAAYSRSASYMGPDGEQLFRKSFSDFESSTNPTMRRAYSEATAFSRFPRNAGVVNGRPSPGWTPNSIGGSFMFPIQEAPEYIRPSLRKVSDDTTLPLDPDDFSFRKDNGTPDEVLDSLDVKGAFVGVKGSLGEPKDDVKAKVNDVNSYLVEQINDDVKDVPADFPRRDEDLGNLTHRPTPPLTPSVSI